MQRSIFLAVPMLLCCTGALAGGSNYGIAPGAKQLTGKVSEWPVPTPKFARDPAPGPYGLALDKRGNVWVCRMNADKMGIVDSKTGKISELYMGPGSRPRRAATAPDGTLWITLYGNGKLAHVDPAAAKIIKEYEMPAGPNGGAHTLGLLCH